jgi:hypothetical protein
MSTQDDEKLAKALQAHYEKQARQAGNRSQQRHDSVEKSTHQRTIEKSSHHQSSGPSIEVKHTSADAELARRLAEEGSLRGASRHKRSFKPNDRYTHHRNTALQAQNLKGEISGIDGKSTHQQKPSVPDTSRDAELAHRLAEGSLRGASRHQRDFQPTDRSTHQRTSATPLPIHHATNGKGEMRVLDEKSIHQQQGRKLNVEKSADSVDTSGDADLARKLAEGSLRGASRQQRGSKPAERSTHHRTTLQRQPSNRSVEATDSELARRLARGEDFGLDQKRFNREGENIGLHTTRQVPDTSADAELARKLAEEGSLRGKSRHQRTTKATERSTHERTAGQLQPSNPVHGVGELSDAELARRLAKGEIIGIDGKSIHQKRTLDGNLGNAEVSPDTSGDVELARKIAEEGSLRGTSMHQLSRNPSERSTHNRTRSLPMPMHPPPRSEKGETGGHDFHATNQHGNLAKAHGIPDMSSDAELARRLAEEGSLRGTSRHQRSPKPTERTTHNRTTSLPMPVHHPPRSETGSHDYNATNQDDNLWKTHAIPDTSSDAELARRLAEEGSLRGTSRHQRSPKLTERSTHNRTPGSMQASNEIHCLQVLSDAELARKLAKGDKLGIDEKSTHRNEGLNVYEGKAGKVSGTSDDAKIAQMPDTSKDEEISLRLDMGLQSSRHHRINSKDRPIASASLSDDEALARKLEKELANEVLSKRIQPSNNKRRRMSATRKKGAQRQHDNHGNNSSLNGNGIPLEGQRKSQDVRNTGYQNQNGRVMKNQIDKQNNSSGGKLTNASDTKIHATHKITPQAGRAQEMSTQHRNDNNHVGKKSKGNSEIPKSSEHSPGVRDGNISNNHPSREVKRISVYAVQDPNVKESKSWTCCRIANLVLPIAVICAAIAGLAYAFTGGGTRMPSIPKPPSFQEEDPFFGGAAEKTRWSNQGSGLELEILNALDERWYTLFEIAIKNWDDGDPDALTLSVTKVEIDHDCVEVTGKLKVCNGDYGDTKWRGINQVILSNGFIVSSVAKLNEFYLATADESQRQYTMCHEIGHGFGLQHTDENFFNADLGNCMVSVGLNYIGLIVSSVPD